MGALGLHRWARRSTWAMAVSHHGSILPHPPPRGPLLRACCSCRASRGRVCGQGAGCMSGGAGRGFLQGQRCMGAVFGAGAHFQAWLPGCCLVVL